jgi:hypothetical protein
VFGATLTDVVILAPGAFLLGLVVGFVIRDRLR